jgi:hypothetical protein
VHFCVGTVDEAAEQGHTSDEGYPPLHGRFHAVSPQISGPAAPEKRAALWLRSCSSLCGAYCIVSTVELI